jgi:hypothetical protein
MGVILAVLDEISVPNLASDRFFLHSLAILLHPRLIVHAAI